VIPQRRPVVSMFTRELNTYRVPFFEQARGLLDARDIEFKLFLGGATGDDRAKADNASLDWAESLSTRSFSVRGSELWWQPAVGVALKSELAITEQATKQLVNLPLSVLQRAGRVRHCLWGHGTNFQASIEANRGERAKRWFTSAAHWFFSYTQLSTRLLVESGFPVDRITTLNNSTDTARVRSIRQSQDSSTPAMARRRLGISDGPVVGYIGGLYPPKRTVFLVESLVQLRQMVPNVSAVIVGTGSEAEHVRRAAEQHEWFHHLGPIYDDERINVAAMFDLLIMPGLVGLNIVDGFAMGLPTITTAIDYHSPEISYLLDGINGVIAPESSTASEFAQVVCELLADPQRLAILRAGAVESGAELGVEPMAEAFASGVAAALERDRR